MKFRDIHQNSVEADGLAEEYRSAHVIGVLRIGDRHIFFRSGLRWYVMDDAEITGFFRRIKAVPAKLCCGKGTFEMEHIVICTGEGEAAEIQMPGKRAAEAALKELREKMPDRDYRAPKPGAAQTRSSNA